MQNNNSLFLCGLNLRNMWQRLQTVFLLIASAINLLLLGLNMAEIEVETQRFFFDIYTMQNGETMEIIYESYFIFPLLVLSALLSLIIVSLYKKRQLQIKLAQLNLFLQVAFIAVFFFIVDDALTSNQWDSEAVVHYGIGTYLSLLPLIFIYLAIRYIKKDDALVRAADRIR